MQLRRRAQPG